MNGTHLFIGSGGEVGRSLSEKLRAGGERVFITSHRTPPDPSLPGPLWDMNSPDEGLPSIDRALGSSPLRSLSLFSHPTFHRQSAPGNDSLAGLDTIRGFGTLLAHLRPRFGPGSTLLFFFPSLSHHKAGSYLFARTWLGAYRGMFEEWSRMRGDWSLTGIEILVTPDRKTPHMTPEMIGRIADRTSRGRLATAEEIADFAFYLIRSGNPLFHGQTLKTEGGPYY